MERSLQRDASSSSVASGHAHTQGMRGASWRRRRSEHEGAALAEAQRNSGAGLVAHMAFSDLWRVSLARKISFRLLPRMSSGPSTSRSWESTSSFDMDLRT
nr:uncharacterized protein LOC127323803 [Lolium perenne]